MMDWYEHGGNGWGGYGWGMVVMVLAMSLVVVAGGWLLFRGTRAGQPTAAESPRAILDRRLASGEIDPETYANLRQALAGASSGPVGIASPR